MALVLFSQQEATLSRFARELSNMGALIHTTALAFQPGTQTSYVPSTPSWAVSAPRDALRTLFSVVAAGTTTPSHHRRGRMERLMGEGRPTPTPKPTSIFDPRPRHPSALRSGQPAPAAAHASLARGKSYTLCMHASGGLAAAA